MCSLGKGTGIGEVNKIFGKTGNSYGTRDTHFYFSPADMFSHFPVQGETPYISLELILKIRLTFEIPGHIILCTFSFLICSTHWFG